MAEDVTVNILMTLPPEQELTQSTFQNGVITLINESNLPPTALKEGTNIFLYEKGAPGPRWGSKWFTSAVPNNASIDGGVMYQSASGANHIVAVAGGNVYRSLDNGATWTICTGATFTAGKKCYFTQASTSGAGNNYMYITNGYDYPVRYDGSTTLVPFVAINAPSTPTVVATGLSTGVYSYYYRVSAVNAVGTTQGSSSGTITTSIARDSWDPTDTGNHYMTLAWAAVSGAVRYDIYLADNTTDDAANNNYYLDSVGAVASPGYVDNGQTVVNPNATVPLQNTTGAPRVRELVAIGSRLWGVEDRDFPYRVWWTGSGPFIGYFSDSYDGGYIDLQKGSQFFPVQVVDYRDGKGDPLTTVFCNSADTRGCIWQIGLSTTTILDTQFTQPSANKLPGSRGTPAPNSVVSVLNDFMFFNYQALYDLGSRTQLFNLLSTDEYSANIRPTLTTNINPANASAVAAYYYLAKVFISVPYNNTVNNGVIVYDTERKAWIPNAYTFGMERLFQFTDTTNTNHLLFWKPGDTQFSETSANIKGDYGVAFNTSLTTGLISTQKDRFAFLYVDQAYVEFAQPQGGIVCELLGIDRIKGYATQKVATVLPATSSSNVGWSTFLWSTTAWSDFTAAPTNYSESSAKRYFVVNKELNAYQWHISTNSTVSSYVLRTLQISGTPTNAGMPRQWRLNPQ